MKKYPKIQSLFHREPKGERKLISLKWSREEFAALQHNRWIATEKIDGTNIRIGWDGERVEFGGRTDNANIHAGLVNFLVQKFPAGFFEDLPPLVLFGEGYGEGIQAVGKDYLPGATSFIMFDVWSPTGYWWPFEEVQKLGYNRGIDVVPFMAEFNIPTAIEFVEAGFKSQIGDAQAEGLILKAPHGICDYKGKRLITKLKTKDKYA